jgi:hypothetical protein
VPRTGRDFDPDVINIEDLKGFKVLASMVMKLLYFGYIIPYIPLKVNRHFRRKFASVFTVRE